MYILGCHCHFLIMPPARRFVKPTLPPCVLCVRKTVSRGRWVTVVSTQRSVQFWYPSIVIEYFSTLRVSQPPLAHYKLVTNIFRSKNSDKLDSSQVVFWKRVCHDHRDHGAPNDYRWCFWNLLVFNEDTETKINILKVWSDICTFNYFLAKSWIRRSKPLSHLCVEYETSRLA